MIMDGIQDAVYPLVRHNSLVGFFTVKGTCFFTYKLYMANNVEPLHSWVPFYMIIDGIWDVADYVLEPIRLI